MQVATLFRESATLLGAASMMESSPSTSTSASTSSLPPIASTISTSVGITLPSGNEYKISTNSTMPSPVSVITVTNPTSLLETTTTSDLSNTTPTKSTSFDKNIQSSICESPLKSDGKKYPCLGSSVQQEHEQLGAPSPSSSPHLSSPSPLHNDMKMHLVQQCDQSVTDDVTMTDLQPLQKSISLPSSPLENSQQPILNPSMQSTVPLTLSLQQDESQSSIPQSPVFQLKSPKQRPLSTSSEHSIEENISIQNDDCEEEKQHQVQHSHPNQELQQRLLCQSDQINLDAINNCIRNENNAESTMQSIDDTTQQTSSNHMTMNMMNHIHHEQNNNNHHQHPFQMQHHMQQQEQDIQHIQQQQSRMEPSQHQFHQHHHQQFHHQMHQQQHHQQHLHHQQHPMTCIDDLMIDDHHDADANNRYKLLSPTVKHENQDDGYETSAGDVMTPNSHTSSSHPLTPHQMHTNVILSKCEVSQPPSSAVDDPYNFIDEEINNSMHMISPVSGGQISVRQQGYATHHPAGPPPGLNSRLINSQLLSINGQMMSSGTSLPTGSLCSDMTPPKKRGRKKKIRDENGTIVNGILKPVVHKERKKHDRFNGMPEEEVSKRTLPDHLTNNLDIIIIGINPGLFAAYKGHHYAGPGNHFWKCLYLSGLTHEQMTAEEDYKLLDFGIGFTNMVERATKGSADLTRKEIKEGCRILLDKLRKFRPKIAVFNGKLIFEVFSGKKDFNFGRQPECIEGTNTYMWVMPSSSARCAQLPRAADKVPFYAALKKFRDYLNGLIPQIDDSECVFSDPKYKVCCESEPKTENIVYTEISDLNLPNNSLSNTNSMLITNDNNSLNNKTCNGMENSDPITPGKKKRGRPKKVKGVDGCDDSKMSSVSRRVTPPNGCNNNSINNLNSINNCNISNSGEIPKKKRGRPKKIKTSDLINGSSLSGIAGTILNSNSNSNGMTNGLEGINNSEINHNSPNNGISSLCSSLNQGRLFSPPMHSPSTVGSYCPIGMNASTPPINSNSNTNNNGYHHQHHHHIPHPHHHHSHHHQPYQHTSQQQQYTPHSDLSSEISAAISSEHLGESPTPTSPSLGPPDFDPPNNMQSDENNPHDLSYSSPASTISEQQSGSHITGHIGGYSTYHNPGSNNSYMSAGGGSSNDGNPNDGYLPQSSQQQLQASANNSQQNLMSDVASKSLSGLESLVDQIPTMTENDGSASAGHTPDSRLCDNDQFTASCIYSGYSSNLQLNSSSSPSATSNSSMLSPHYSNPNYSNNSNCTTSNSITYGSLSSNFSVSSLTSSNYPTSSYRTNLNLAASPHHLSGSSSGSPMYMEPHMPVPVNPLYHPYSQHTGYGGYSTVAPPPTIHMPSPNYPYGYGNAGSYPQPGHHPTHPSYLTNHPSMFDRIKPDIGYGGF